MLLSGTSVQNQAKANFQAIVINPKTTQRLKAILNNVVQANQGKPREEARSNRRSGPPPHRKTYKAKAVRRG